MASASPPNSQPCISNTNSGNMTGKANQYHKHYNRIQTFKQLKINQELSQLAEAGFYYTCFDDIAQCFSCGFRVSLRTWKFEDSPWVKHCQLSTHCDYLANEMGNTFIENVKQLSNSQIQVTYSDALMTMSGKQFVDRCWQGATPHYHHGMSGRRCREDICSGLTTELKYPQYRTFSSRRSTLDLECFISTKSMIADAGYFYHAGCLFCFECGDEKRVLNPGEIAAVEHARTSPHCQYLRLEFGDLFIHIVQEMEKCDEMDFKTLIEHLPQWEHRFSEKAVQNRLKVDIANGSGDELLEEDREEMYKHRIRPACGNCKKGNSASQCLDCCGVKWCIDCANRTKCPCGDVLNLGQKHF